MKIKLVSFFDGDRSGKVRWLAHELGIEVEEERVRFSATQAPGFELRSPLRVVPVVEFDGHTLTESTATCHWLAEQVEQPQLWVPVGDPRRHAYLRWISAFAENCEAKLVECVVSLGGRLPPEVFEANAPRMRERLEIYASMLPEEGYLVGDFSLADIVAGYSLRLGVQASLVERDAVEPYLSRLISRPAAQAANFFDGVEAR